MTDSPDLNRLRIDRSASSARRQRTRRRGIVKAVVLLALVGAALWLFRAPLRGLLDRWTLPEVRVVEASAGNPAAAGALSGIAANGYVVAARRAALSADTPGRIVELNVEEGSVVRTGDVVARLYADEYEAALRRAEAELTTARVGVDRAQAEEEAALRDVDSAQAAVDAAGADVREAEAAVRLAEAVYRRVQGLVESDAQTEQELDDAQAALDRARAALAAAQARVTGAEAGVARARARGTVAKAATAEAQTAVAVRQALRDQAEATLDKTVVRAPFDGVVVLKDAEVGEVVSPNSQGASSRGSVATMVDFASLEVQVDLPETSLAQVAVGAEARVYLDAWPETAYAGRVTRIWPTANRQKGTIELRVGFDGPDARLRPEMGARVVFPGPDQPAGPEPEADADAVWLPAGCVVPVDGRDGVFLLERDVVRFRAIETGTRRGSRVAVRDGVAAGDRVVLDPPPTLADGARVRVAQ